MTRLYAVTGFCLVTNDLARLTRFYVEALGFSPDGAAAAIPSDELALLELSGGGERQRMSLGEQSLSLERFANPGQPYPEPSNAASPWFQHLAIVVTDINAAYARLHAAAGATPISEAGPQRLPASSGGVTAFKFRDPDGHPLELLQFADAPPAWRDRKAVGGEALGIDHSAISVADVAASRAFYAGIGLAAGTPSLNEGAEQQRLDALPGAVVDVLPMLPTAGVPHLELLGYRAPRDPRPVRSHSTDIAATRMLWRASVAALVIDPDGHRHQTAP